MSFPPVKPDCHTWPFFGPSYEEQIVLSPWGWQAEAAASSPFLLPVSNDQMGLSPSLMMCLMLLETGRQAAPTLSSTQLSCQQGNVKAGEASCVYINPELLSNFKVQ